MQRTKCFDDKYESDRRFQLDTTGTLLLDFPEAKRLRKLIKNIHGRLGYREIDYPEYIALEKAVLQDFRMLQVLGLIAGFRKRFEKNGAYFTCGRLDVTFHSYDDFHSFVVRTVIGQNYRDALDLYRLMREKPEIAANQVWSDIAAVSCFEVGDYVRPEKVEIPGSVGPFVKYYCDTKIDHEFFSKRINTIDYHWFGMQELLTVVEHQKTPIDICTDNYELKRAAQITLLVGDRSSSPYYALVNRVMPSAEMSDKQYVSKELEIGLDKKALNLVGLIMNNVNTAELKKDYVDQCVLGKAIYKSFGVDKKGFINFLDLYLTLRTDPIAIKAVEQLFAKYKKLSLDSMYCREYDLMVPELAQLGPYARWIYNQCLQSQWLNSDAAGLVAICDIIIKSRRPALEPTPKHQQFQLYLKAVKTLEQTLGHTNWADAWRYIAITFDCPQIESSGNSEKLKAKLAVLTEQQLTSILELTAIAFN